MGGRIIPVYNTNCVAPNVTLPAAPFAQVVARYGYLDVIDHSTAFVSQVSVLIGNVEVSAHVTHWSPVVVTMSVVSR